MPTSTTIRNDIVAGRLWSKGRPQIEHGCSNAEGRLIRIVHRQIRRRRRDRMNEYVEARDSGGFR
jgi:hypothetical protein